MQLGIAFVGRLRGELICGREIGFNITAGTGGDDRRAIDSDNQVGVGGAGLFHAQRIESYTPGCDEDEEGDDQANLENDLQVVEKRHAAPTSGKEERESLAGSFGYLLLIIFQDFFIYFLSFDDNSCVGMQNAHFIASAGAHPATYRSIHTGFVIASTADIGPEA
jgi:hypothetical protein